MWRFLHTPPSTGAFNMALDEALMSYASDTQQWIFRVYSWTAPTLSLGRHQVARGAYDRKQIAERGIDVVRRPTGGRAILHHREVTYSAVGPVAAAGDLRESYARINRLLIAALHQLGVDAAVVPVTRIQQTTPGSEGPGLLPCFHHPSSGEITHHGRKLVGSAQWRCNDAFLQHGSILVDDDQMQLSSLLITKGPEIQRPATLREAVGRVPSESEVARALFDAVCSSEDPDAMPMKLDTAILDRAKDLCEHYLDESWTWRH